MKILKISLFFKKNKKILKIILLLYLLLKNPKLKKDED